MLNIQTIVYELLTVEGIYYECIKLLLNLDSHVPFVTESLCTVYTDIALFFNPFMLLCSSNVC